MPTAGSAVDRNSYPLCASVTTGVNTGWLIHIGCASSTEQYRYIIVQSVDTRAEKLCIAEVCVYAEGQ